MTLLCDVNPEGFLCGGLSHTGTISHLPLNVGQKAFCVPTKSAADDAILHNVLPDTISRVGHSHPGMKSILFPDRFPPIPSRCCANGIQVNQRGACPGSISAANHSLNNIQPNQSEPFSKAMDSVMMSKLSAIQRFI